MLLGEVSEGLERPGPEFVYVGRVGCGVEVTEVVAECRQRRSLWLVDLQLLDQRIEERKEFQHQVVESLIMSVGHAAEPFQFRGKVLHERPACTSAQARSIPRGRGLWRRVLRGSALRGGFCAWRRRVGDCLWGHPISACRCPS